MSELTHVHIIPREEETPVLPQEAEIKCKKYHKRSCFEMELKELPCKSYASNLWMLKQQNNLWTGPRATLYPREPSARVTKVTNTA